jgi:putative transposase
MDWPHSPPHRFLTAGTYFITAATHHQQHLYRAPEALDDLQTRLFDNARKHACALQAWAIFSNHYHLVVAADAGEHVRLMLARLHTEAAIDINHRDGVRGRKVWFQFWDVQLTYEASWLARLKYTHENAVHHGLVQEATRYRWCSAAWFAENARASFVETVRRVKIDRVKVREV